MSAPKSPFKVISFDPIAPIPSIDLLKFSVISSGGGKGRTRKGRGGEENGKKTTGENTARKRGRVSLRGGSLESPVTGISSMLVVLPVAGRDASEEQEEEVAKQFKKRGFKMPQLSSRNESI